MKEFYKSNTFLAVVSVIIAVVIWIYVVYEVNPMYETWITDVPVKCANVSDLFEEGSLVITGENESLLKNGVTMSIRVKGKRSVVSSIKQKNFSCVICIIKSVMTLKFSLYAKIIHCKINRILPALVVSLLIKKALGIEPAGNPACRESEKTQVIPQHGYIIRAPCKEGKAFTAPGAKL